jgi:hypothetical protein
VALFAVVFSATGLHKSFVHIADTSRVVVKVLADPDIEDDAKEEAARQGSVELLKISLFVALKGAATLVAAMLPFAVSDALGLRPWNETVAFALRPDVLVITTIVMVGGWYLWRHLRA